MLLRNSCGKIKIVDRNNFVDDNTFHSHIYYLNYQKNKNFTNIQIQKNKSDNYSVSLIKNLLKK